MAFRTALPALVTSLSAISLLACSGEGSTPRDNTVDPFEGPSDYAPGSNNGNDTTGDPYGSNGSGSMDESNTGDEGTPDVQVAGQLGSGTMTGSGSSSQRYQSADVTRDGKNYRFIANGWGPGFESQSVSWNGTAFTVEAMQGAQGPQYQPASYPTVFCGVYSDQSSGECGLPRALSDIDVLQTGWRWAPNGNAGQYNAAYDIWMGNGPNRSDFSGYLMVWYREPPGQQPAGAPVTTGIQVENVPGTWDIWVGEVGGRPIINWVRAEGDDTYEMEFDVMDFVRDAELRNLQLPGTHVLSVAVGFEIWNGPVSNLESLDFYVDVQ